MMNQSVFKSYDVRGIYQKELDEETAFQIARSFVTYAGIKNVVVAYDARVSSRTLFKSLAMGMSKEGAQITSIGQLPTECLYFAVANYDFDSGVMITASHNQKEYNGFKLMRKDEKNIQMVRGKDLLSVLSAVEQNDAGKEKEVMVTHKDILQDYITYISSFFDFKKITRFKIIVDASNGVIGTVMNNIKDMLPVEMIGVNFEPDGNFPNHSPNPLTEGALHQLQSEIKKQHADFGFIFDGDADRVFLTDEKGKLVPADITLLLLAKYFLVKNPDAGIAYNAICSKAVPEFIKKWGGVPIRTPVGFVNVRDGLLHNNGVIGGELSGHYCFRDYFYMDSGMLAFLTLLQIISADGRKVSEMVKELSVYFKSSELNFKIENKNEVLEKIKEKYDDGKQDFLDGVTVAYKDWWFNIRPSNTEPLLRLTIEADTQKLLNQKQKELSEFVQS